MKTFVLFLLSLAPLYLLGQAVKLKKVKFKKSNLVKEQYYVLKKKKSIRHGEYLLLDANQMVKIQGQYKNNLKDGRWIYYKPNGHYAKVEYYTNGEKTGIWQKFVENGYAIERYDHDNDQALDPIIEVTIVYPPLAREKNVSGLVEIQVFFEEDCTIREMKSLSSVGTGCEEAVRDAVQRYVDLRHKYHLPIEECMEKEKTYRINFSLE